MLTIDAFLATLIEVTHALNYEARDRKTQERYNWLLGFRLVRRTGISAARVITADGYENGFAAKAGDYHVRPLNSDYHFTDDLGWVVDSGIFSNTYEWLTFERLGNPPNLDGGWGACRKRVGTWVFDTGRLYPWDGAVIVSCIEGEQPMYWGDWLALGGKGEMWPIPAKDTVNLRPVEGVTL